MTPEKEITATPETPKYRHLTTKYLRGCGLDIGSGGYAPVVNHAITVELPMDLFLLYSSGRPPEYDIHLTCGALNLPFKKRTLDWVYSSHLIEDFADWIAPLHEWTRVIKIGGHIVLLYPDKERWAKAIAAGQPPNCQHRHESFVGEMTALFTQYFPAFEVLEDRFADTSASDYSILFAARRIK